MQVPCKFWKRRGMQAVPLGRGWGRCWLGGRRGADSSLSVEAQQWGSMAQVLGMDLPRGVAGQGSGHSIPDEGWPGVAPYGFFLSPFQSSTPLLDPGLEACGDRVWLPSSRCAAVPDIAPTWDSGTATQLTRLMGGDRARFVYKPVYPSIYMLHRMYICWEHARFCVSLLCVLCSTAQSPNLALAGVGAEVMLLPQQIPPSPPRPAPTCPFVFSAVHASIGLMQPPFPCNFLYI